MNLNAIKLLKGENAINAEKKRIFEDIENSHDHFFITGKAGTGKSHLLTYLKKHTSKTIAICAPTGVAAINVRGQTIHSLFKLPPNLIVPGSLPKNNKMQEIIRHIDLLVIDEISMVRVDLMDAIDERFRQAKGSKFPFGGTQIVMFGDPYQLPPVIGDKELHHYLTDTYGGSHFFNANVWQHTNFRTQELTEVFRQKDQSFITLLDLVRIGQVDSATLETFNRRTGSGKSQTITLTTNNNKVNQINSAKLRSLTSPEFVYKAGVTGNIDEKYFPAEEFLRLKKGAQVMMLKNDQEKRWVNGSIGIIDSIDEKNINVSFNGTVHPITQGSWEKIEYDYDREEKKIKEKVIGSFAQYPIRLAWAITIHKSQGQTFESVHIDLDTGAFATGQTYVALSRCRTLEGLTLERPIAYQDIKVDPNIAKFMSLTTSDISR